MTSLYFIRKRQKSLSKSKAVSIEQRLEQLEKASQPEWTARLANLSQIAMLGVVLFGYFYTVIPVVQKEQIAEKLAQLEIEKKHWSQTLSGIKAELEEKQLELANLNTQTELALKAIQNITNERDNILSSLKSKSNELKIVNRKLTSANRSIDIAKENLTSQIESQILGERAISDTYLSVLDKYTETAKLTDEKGYFGLPIAQLLWAAKDKDYTNSIINNFHQISPYSTLDILTNEINEKIKQSKGIERDAHEAILKKYAYAKSNKQKILTCPTLPLDEWKATYNSLDGIVNEFSNKCVTKTMDKFKEKGTYSAQKSNLGYYSSVCKTNISGEIRRLLSDKWTKVLSPCRERVTRLNEIVLKDLKEEQLKPFDDLRPPSIELITTNINSYVKNNEFFRFDD